MHSAFGNFFKLTQHGVRISCSPSSKPHRSKTCVA